MDERGIVFYELHSPPGQHGDPNSDAEDVEFAELERILHRPAATGSMQGADSWDLHGGFLCLAVACMGHRPSLSARKVSPRMLGIACECPDRRRCRAKQQGRQAR